MIPAGQFRHPITIESAPEVRGGTGQFIADWSQAQKVCDRRAIFVPKGGKEFNEARIEWAEMDWMLKCRGRADIKPSMRVVTADGRFMEILEVYSPDGRPPKSADLLTIICKESVS